MKSLLPNSLPVRAWLAVITISAIYFISALSSGFIAWVSEDDAQAINIAGSVRMATYRINYLLATDFEDRKLIDIALLEQINQSDQNLQLNRTIKPEQPSEDKLTELTKNKQPKLAVADDLQNRLNSLQNYQSKFSNSNDLIDKNISKQLSHIIEQWESQLKPALLDEDTQGFYQQSKRFITDVDTLVSQLQQRNESRQELQQTIQIASLILSMLIMLAGLWELKYKVLLPVNKLKEANERFKTGKQNTRVDITGYIEFKALGNSFNQMAEKIENHQALLETEVTVKTAHLTQANQVLSLLYDFAQSLTTTKVSIVELDRLLSDFEKIIPKLKFTLCLQSANLDDKDSIALHGNRLQEVCSTSSCEKCAIKSSQVSKSYLLKNQGEIFGELRVQPKHNYFYSSQNPKTSLNIEKYNPANAITNLIDENDEAILALSNLISTALSIKHQRYQENKIILLEERATMARELHDSLAQSLSYLKIQVSILETNLKHANLTDTNSPVDESINKIKQGLHSSYQHLRDLLITFRLKIDDDGFDAAIAKSAEEFSQKGGVEIKVKNYVNGLHLSAIEQVNLIQIIRESLSNISRHSEATKAEVFLKYDQNTIIVTIKDNGIGLNHDFDQTHHHGLMIMKERANSLGGEFAIKPNSPNGTIVKAHFVPAFFKAENA